MDRAWISRGVLGVALLIAACGDSGGDKPSEGSEMMGVGRYGGDCVDGATRCTDAFGAPLCPVNSNGHDGDDLAICQPASFEEGMLLHYGPKDYNDPAEIAKYMLGASASKRTVSTSARPTPSPCTSSGSTAVCARTRTT